MAKKKGVTETVEASENTAVATEAPTAATRKRGRGRPKGSSKKPAAKAKGRPGRPKGSKNQPKSLITTGKRPRGRPAGPSKKAGVALSGLRGVIVQIVREEVHAALLQAFKDM